MLHFKCLIVKCTNLISQLIIIINPNKLSIFSDLHFLSPFIRNLLSSSQFLHFTIVAYFLPVSSLFFLIKNLAQFLHLTQGFRIYVIFTRFRAFTQLFFYSHLDFLFFLFFFQVVIFIVIESYSCFTAYNMYFFRFKSWMMNKL